jgi:hypothetical protein
VISSQNGEESPGQLMSLVTAAATRFKVQGAKVFVTVSNRQWVFAGVIGINEPSSRRLSTSLIGPALEVRGSARRSLFR